MITLICIALLAVAHAAPRLNQEKGNIPNIPIPYEMLQQALQDKENNLYNTIQVKNINELRGGPNDDAEETNVDRATFEDLTPDDIQTAIRIAAALEYVVLRDAPIEDSVENSDGENSSVYVVNHFEEPNNVIDSGAESQSKDLNLKYVNAKDPSKVRFVNMVVDDELGSPNAFI